MKDYNWFSGDKIKVGIYGESHSEDIGVRLEGLDYSSLDEEKLRAFMKRRAPGQNAWSTPRKEADEVIIDKLENGLFEAHILNTNIRPSDYSNLLRTPRPSHADFTAGLKYGPNFKSSGGGSFSGRLTAPMCIAGFLALTYLSEKGIRISSRIKSIGGVSDGALDLEKLKDVRNKEFPVIDDEAGEKMKKVIEEARTSEDSVGGVIETVIEGMPGGIGGPIFEGIEGKIAQICFAIPAVKGIEFGNGFEAAKLHGSENNDSLVFEDGKLKLETNRCGGILGGISVGGDVAPIVFDCAIKPTPTIGKEQRTVDLETKENTTLKAKGRHDPCIVPRAVPVFEAAAALAIADLI
ncbi:MAG: chorismate synthase [Clostridiales bacterium]|nr:chorismate synthase [Clostridiales bacterium]